MQSRRHSVLEVLTNTTVGMIGSWLITYGVLRYVRDPEWQATAVVLVCTVWSVARGYVVRRRFAKREAPVILPADPEGWADRKPIYGAGGHVVQTPNGKMFYEHNREPYDWRHGETVEWR